jgi:hypothetical protein
MSRWAAESAHSGSVNETALAPNHWTPSSPTLTAKGGCWAVGSSEIDHLERAEGRKAQAHNFVYAS